MESNQDSLESYNVAQLHERLMQDTAEFESLDFLEDAISSSIVRQFDAKSILPPSRGVNHHVQQRPLIPPNSKAPRLRATESAPNMAVTFDDSPTQAHGDAIKSKSFPNFPAGYDGDTQPLESQVYRDYTKSIAMQQSRSIAALYNDSTQHTTQQENSLADGDSGHVDLMQHVAQSTGPDYHEISSDGGSDDDEAGRDESQYLLSSVNRQAFPRTPATAGQKRNRRGEPVSAASIKSPGSGLSAFNAFGPFGDAAAMSATQMFQATQAASSPLQDAPRSDPIFTRPSPNINHHSSPLLNFESPTTVVYAAQQGRATTEPRDTYLSLKESQARRDRTARDGYRSSMGPPTLRDMNEDFEGVRIKPGQDDEDEEQDQDEDDDSAQLRQVRKRQHTLLRNEAMQNWGAVTAPERSASRRSIASPDYGEHVPRITFRRSASRDRELAQVPDEPSPGSDPLDEYDELAGEVRQSQHDETMLDSEAENEEVQEDEQEDMEADDSHDSPLLEEPIPQEPASQQDIEPVSPQPGTDQPVANPGVEDYDVSAFTVADSQPGRQETQQPPLPIGPSSMSSIVPASQFPNALTHDSGQDDHDHLANEFSILVPPTNGQLNTLHATQRVPSSPPQVPVAPIEHEGITTDSDIAHVGDPKSPLRRPISHEQMSIKDRTQRSSPSPASLSLPSSAKVPPQRSHKLQSSTIPETDPVEHPDGPAEHLELSKDAPSLFRGDSEDAVQTEPPLGTAPATFETAPTHIGGPLSGQQQSSQHQNSQVTDESPRKAAGILRFADISTDLTPPDHDIDVDFDVLTTDDRSYVEAMSEPVNKRLKTYGRKAKRINNQGVRLAGDTSKGQAPIFLAIEHPSQEPSAALPAVAGKEVAEGDQQQVSHEGYIVGTDEHSRSSCSPMKPPAIPTDKRNTRPLPLTNTLPATPGPRDGARTAKRGKLTRVKGRTPKTSLSPRRVAEIAETPQHTATATAPPPESRQVHDDETHYTAEVDNTAAEPQAPPVTSNPAPETPLNPIEPPRSSSSSVWVLGRVFALFIGTGQAYYPATCLGASTLDGQKLRVRFDDATTTQIEPHLLRRLELRRGDQVKVDLPGLRKKVYVVTGFKDQNDTSSAGPESKTDVHGFAAVQLIVKEKDGTLQTPIVSAAATLTIPITHLYLTHSMFVKFDDRAYAPAVPQVLGSSRSARHSTPVTDLALPTTPAFRSRRYSLLTGGSTVRSDLASPQVRTESVFAGMAFAVSYSANNTEKDRVLSLIQRNGGIVLEQGFDEMFEPIELLDSDTPFPDEPKDRTLHAPTEDDANGLETLKLSPRSKSLGFVALIADKHSRRAKYIQALALSIPCLSGRWVLDSVTTGTPAHWPKYLLPAGESVYLSGAIRSRTLAPYSAVQAKLADTVRSRERLLQGGKVLLVGGAKAKWEARKAYAFLTIALGATSVRKVGSLDAAKRILEQEGEAWKWVYIDGKIEDAERALFGTCASASESGGSNAGPITASASASATASAKGASRKRKRAEEGGDHGGNKMVAGNGKVKIVGDEFVVQSLILGSLLEP